MTVDTVESPGIVPLRTGFDVVLRGFDRHQVQSYVEAAEADLRLVSEDRDAAVAHAQHLVEVLERTRAEVRELTERLDRVCRSPVDADGLSERLRRLAELAHAEAEEITSRARAAAEQQWSTAREATRRLRERHEQVIADLDRRRAEMEAEHRELMRRAHADVEETTRRAEVARRGLDERAARLRARADADFETALAIRRRQADREIDERLTGARAEAARIVAAARTEAGQLLEEARAEAALMRSHRDRVARSLREAQALLTAAGPLLVEPPENRSGPTGDRSDRAGDQLDPPGDRHGPPGEQPDPTENRPEPSQGRFEPPRQPRKPSRTPALAGVPAALAS